MSCIAAVICVVVVWIWYIYLCHPNFEEYEYSEIAGRLKTGDIILFHALDNCFPIGIGCYYGHIGLVYVAPDKQPYILEAFNPERMPYYPEANRHGIIMTPAGRRLQTFRGYTFYKELTTPIVDATTLTAFDDFVKFANRHMFYERSVVSNAITKLLFNDSLRLGTNCAELVYLGLIVLNILPKDAFDQNNKHHLLYLANLQETCTNSYKEPVYVMSNYFKN